MNACAADWVGATCHRPLATGRWSHATCHKTRWPSCTRVAICQLNYGHLCVNHNQHGITHSSRSVFPPSFSLYFFIVLQHLRHCDKRSISSRDVTAVQFGQAEIMPRVASRCCSFRLITETRVETESQLSASSAVCLVSRPVFNLFYAARNFYNFRQWPWQRYNSNNSNTMSCGCCNRRWHWHCTSRCCPKSRNM